MWKVYHIQTGKLIRGGFDVEDAAKDWIERRKDLAEDDYDVTEMDEEEEEEYLENGGDEDDFDDGPETMPEPLYTDDSYEPGESNRPVDAGSEFDEDDSGYSVVDDDLGSDDDL